MKLFGKNIHTGKTFLVGLQVAALACLVFACSTKKTGWAHRSYHNMTSRYNGYFNAKEIIKFSLINLEKSHVENFDNLLPIYIYNNETAAQSLTADMDKAIEKCTKVIKRHSIEQRNKEHTKWIDNSYFVIGQANYLKGDNVLAKQFLDFVPKKYKEEDSKNDAFIWLAKTLYKDGNYEKAERILRMMENNSDLEKKQKAEIHKVYADMHIQRKDYQQAIPEIKNALQYIKRRWEKRRLTYLLGQLYKEEGERQNASAMFAAVIKMNPDYRMMFYAKIQQAMAYDNSFGGKDAVRNQLEKMLRDEKYIEFRDQIYYALAEIEHRDGNIEKTLELLKKSTQVSINNDQQKALSFLKMGEIHFKDQNYEPAQTNYDSCVAFLSSDYHRYDEVLRIAENLNDLITQIRIINREDSLQNLAKMPEKERDKIIAGLIQERMEKEERMKAEYESKQFQDENDNPFGQNTAAPGPGLGGGAPSTKWYFYNPSTVGLGAAEFKRVWGSRKNEDNWRRSNKNQISFEEVKNEEQGELKYIINEKGDTVFFSTDWQEPSYYLKDLPLDEEALLASNKKMIEAYNELAMVYKEQLEDMPKSIETLETLNERFSPHIHQASAYYKLYRMYTDIGPGSKADEYKQKILSEFPNSDYAKLILDPDYFLKNQSENLELKALYEQTYGYFNRGFYSQTVQNANQAIESYDDTLYIPKFKLLKALAIGKDMGKNEMIRELQKVQIEYEGKEAGIKAAELIAAIESIELARLEEEKQAKEEAERINMPSPYSFEPNTKHNVIVISYGDNPTPVFVKNKIAGFNGSSFRMDGLQVSLLSMYNDTQMVVIKSFDNRKKAESYLQAFQKDNVRLKEVNEAKFPVFLISFNNFAVFYERKNIEEYLYFYQKNYK